MPTISFRYLCGGGTYARELTIVSLNQNVGTLEERTGHVQLPTPPGRRWSLYDHKLQREVFNVVADALPHQEHIIIMPPAEAGAPPAEGAGCNAFARGKAKLQGLASCAHYNGSEVTIMYYVPERGRWAMHLDGGASDPNPSQLLVRPEHLRSVDVVADHLPTDRLTTDVPDLQRHVHLSRQHQALNEEVHTDRLLVGLGKVVLCESHGDRRLPNCTIAKNNHLVLELLRLVFGVFGGSRRRKHASAGHPTR